MEKTLMHSHCKRQSMQMDSPRIKQAYMRRLVTLKTTMCKDAQAHVKKQPTLSDIHFQRIKARSDMRHRYRFFGGTRSALEKGEIF